MNAQMLIKLRSKKLAVLMTNARQVARRSPEECANAIGVALDTFKAFEAGLQSPTLPQVEALAFFLNVPLDHFWGKNLISLANSNQPLPNLPQISQLRNRMTSARLGLERSQANLSLEDLANQTGIDPSELEKYEKEAVPIPLPELEALCLVLEIPIEELFDQKGPAGKQRKEQELLRHLSTLPEDLQNFIRQPVNQPFLELAMRLQGMPVDKLRSIAEGLLEITY